MSQTTSLTIHPEHLEDLQKSGLNQQTIEQAGLYSLNTPSEIGSHLGYCPDTTKSALVFTYPAEGFTRLKVYPPALDKDGHKRKYLQASGSGVHLYIPPQIKEKLSNPSVPLYITEGEKKTLKAVQEGLCCIGLGGVWNWKTSEEDGPIDEIERLNLVNRVVYILFDSDFITNDSIKLAMVRLGKELERLGALVKVRCLPSLSADGKTGLDDYLLIHSIAELEQLPTIKLNHSLFKDIKPKSSSKDDAGFPTQMTAYFDGLVDLVEKDGQPAFLIIEDGLPKIVPQLQKGSILLIPPPTEQIPWLLPKADEIFNHHDIALERDDLATDTALVQDLIRYHKSVSELPTEEHYLLLAVYDLHTYLWELFDYSPILCFFAVPERGKSRTARGVVNIAYRGIHEVSLREANVFRYAQDWHTTIFFDFMDFWGKVVKANCDDLILARPEKSAIVSRVLYPEKGPINDTVRYKVFGPTLIATNKDIDDVLATRTIPITMQDAKKRFDLEVKAENSLTLKERLVEFRLRHLGKPLPHVSKAFNGRFGDITRPLLQMIKLACPDKETEFLKLLTDIEKERKGEKAEGLNAQIIKATLLLENSVLNGFLPVKEITRLLNEGKPERFHFSPQKIGRELKALGFKKGKTADGGSAIHFDSAKLERLKASYGLAETPETSDISGRSDGT